MGKQGARVDVRIIVVVTYTSDEDQKGKWRKWETAAGNSNDHPKKGKHSLSSD
jgi:hypothetical protein